MTTLDYIFLAGFGVIFLTVLVELWSIGKLEGRYMDAHKTIGRYWQ